MASDTRELIEVETIKQSSNGDVEQRRGEAETVYYVTTTTESKGTTAASLKQPQDKSSAARMKPSGKSALNEPQPQPTSSSFTPVIHQPSALDPSVAPQPASAPHAPAPHPAPAPAPALHAPVIYPQASRMPHRTVGTVQKQPPTFMVLSAVGFLINPLCGALALWQSWYSDRAFLLGDLEAARVRAWRARTFTLLGVVLTAAAAVTFYFFWVRAFEQPTQSI